MKRKCEDSTQHVQLQALRVKAAELIATAGESNGEGKAKYKKVVKDFIDAGGATDDLIVRIGTQFFGCPAAKTSQGPVEDAPFEGSRLLDFDYLEKFMVDCFVASGTPEKESKVCANVLIEADKRGIDSHGIGRLKSIYMDRIKSGILKPFAPIDVIRETETTALIDANMGIGLYVGPHCMDIAINKAKKYGLGFVAVRNSTHYGIAGYYATMATSRGCIGFCGTNARPSIAPTFGVEPCLGTNPLCFGIPTDEAFPFVIDCATSICQRGKVEKYARIGSATPKGMVIDSTGEERTDTEGILKGMVKGDCALCPMGGGGDELGGYKGYSWATVVELLSIAFQGGDFGRALSGVGPDGKPSPMSLGHFFLAINVEAVCDADAFKKKSGDFLRYLRGSAKDPNGPGRIWTAGEDQYDYRNQRTANGGVMVPPALLKDMKSLREYLPGLPEKYPKFCFED
ncbi:mdh [Symbiodinium natans]|uniref:Mdh protein n=1 Tax=Symbiodinium natans TaxID=878477 RepID=A0A812UJB4_9DINO|nr:mdh [Symbiodinium natans]